MDCSPNVYVENLRRNESRSSLSYTPGMLLRSLGRTTQPRHAVAFHETHEFRIGAPKLPAGPHCHFDQITAATHRLAFGLRVYPERIREPLEIFRLNVSRVIQHVLENL